jgi:opacity protein-like surface antigen
MRFKTFIPPILTGFLFAAALPVFAQVAPAYRAPGIPLSVGAGPSSYDVDWGHGRMLGGTVWADWYPEQIEYFAHVRGLGVELEARDISLDRHTNPGQANPSRSGQANTRQDTAGGGPIFTWRHFHRFQPYGKFLISDGSVDFISSTPTYSHDTRMLIAPGGGFEYRFLGPLKVRADYEYQFWLGNLLGNTLNPQGFTVGVAYDFSHPRGR